MSEENQVTESQWCARCPCGKLCPIVMVFTTNMCEVKLVIFCNVCNRWGSNTITLETLREKMEERVAEMTPREQWN